MTKTETNREKKRTERRPKEGERIVKTKKRIRNRKIRELIGEEKREKVKWKAT